MFNLTQIRHELHMIPEPSGSEIKTSNTIKKYLKECKPDEIITNVGGHGILALFNSKKSGPLIIIRAELDGLPIKEKNNIPYISIHDCYSHSCGHDGHMTIVLGLGFWLKKHINNLKGKVALLFQPAEENATGAKQVLKDKKFGKLKPDYIFSLHNIPGFPKGSILLKKEVFSQASKGLIIKLIGKTSHAASPDEGNNPVFAMNKIIQNLTEIPDILAKQNTNLVTIIHVKLGEIAFGTSPGVAVIMATFRSQEDKQLLEMSKLAENLIKKAASNHKLKYSIEWVDYFPALKNDSKCIDIIDLSAKKIGYKVKKLEKPFLWSEDFSYFTQKINGAMLGLGSGKNNKYLHNPDYNFPDDLLETGVGLFKQIILTILKKNKEK